MKEYTIYRSPEGKAKILTFYDEQLSKLNFDYEDLIIETRFGSTLITAGPKDGHPMILFHGGNSLNPFDLKSFISLADKYRIYAPDTIGHPGKSAEVRLSPKNYSYGEWAIDILDSLGLDKSIIIHLLAKGLFHFIKAFKLFGIACLRSQLPLNNPAPAIRQCKF